MVYWQQSKLKFFIYFVITPLMAMATITVSNVSAKPPNILLIMVDDMGYESVGVYGGISSQTPALDTLAAEGMRFEYAYSQPLCTPSRVKIMTGLFNFRNYVNWGKLEPGEATFARYLREQGYRTLLSGKWQLNEHGGQSPWDAENGFDEVITKRSTTYEGNPYWGHPMVTYQDGIKTNIDDAQAFIPDLCAAFTRDFIQRHAQAQQPFFAYRPMYLPHSPEVCTPDQASGPDCALSNQERYTAMVEYMDKEVGSLLQLLDDLGIRQDTLVMFTSDNGAIGRLSFELSDGTIVQGGKGRMTDAGTRVPFMASWPGVIPMNVTNLNPIDFSVVTPTLLHAAMAPELPASAMQDQLRQFDGPSLLDQLRGEAGHPRGWAYNYFEPKRPSNPDVFAEFVRDERYKLYRDGKFFDVQEDPLEKAPISASAGSVEANAARTRLQHILDQIHQCQEVCKYDCRERACAASEPSPEPPPDPSSPCALVATDGEVMNLQADGQEVKLPSDWHTDVDLAQALDGYELWLYQWYGSSDPFALIQGTSDLDPGTRVKKIKCDALDSPEPPEPPSEPPPDPSAPCALVATDGEVMTLQADGQEVKLPSDWHTDVDLAQALDGYELWLYQWYGSSDPFALIQGTSNLDPGTRVKKIKCDALDSPEPPSEPPPTPSAPCALVATDGEVMTLQADGQEVKLPSDWHTDVDLAQALDGYELWLYQWYGSSDPFAQIQGTSNLDPGTQVKKIKCDALDSPEPPSEPPPTPSAPCEVATTDGEVTGFAGDGQEVKLPKDLHKTIDLVSTQEGYQLLLFTWYGSTMPFTEAQGSLDLDPDTQVKKVQCEVL